MVPEEHSYRAFKQLIYRANWQWEIDDTINSIITLSGKGWIAVGEPCTYQGDFQPTLRRAGYGNATGPIVD